MARVIKRYENRKLYDTEASQYVSLSDLADLVRDGATVQVIDNTSGDDITSFTLTQVILDESKRGRHPIPSDVLHDLLREGGRALDSGLDQIKSGVDGLMQTSLNRVSQLMTGPRVAEMKQLRHQLNTLEQLLAGLIDDPEPGPDID